MPLEILFVDQSTMSGLLISWAIHGIMGIYSDFGTILYGLLFINLIMNYKMGVELLAEDFKNLDKMWTGEVEATIAYRHAFLRNICIKRQDMNLYDSPGPFINS